MLVHDKYMKRTNHEKYLGDLVSNSGNAENIENRRKLGGKQYLNYYTL